MTEILTVQCPECGSTKFWKSGTRKDGCQRYLCRECGFRFTLRQKKSKAQKPIGDSGKSAKPGSNPGSKNLLGLRAMLEETEERDGRRQAGATEKTGVVKVVQFLLQLERDGKSSKTARAYRIALSQLLKKGADLFNPETVKDAIAQHEEWSTATKRLAVAAYKGFADHYSIHWKPPRYRVEHKEPKIPLESDIDQLIAYCGKKTATILQFIKETAARIGETLRVEWNDIDFKRKLVSINKPAKHGNPRTLPISPQLIGMLSNLPDESNRIFGKTTVIGAGHNLNIQRKKAAKKLNNKRLLQIRFHLIRHWKLTMVAHDTNAPYHVKYVAGHKNIQNTDKYVHLEKAIFNQADDKFFSAVAKTAEEARKLIETGFDYVATTKEDLMLFRKRR